MFVCDLFFAVKNIYRGCWLNNNGFGTLLENNLTYYGSTYNANKDTYSLKDVQESCKKLAKNAGKGFYGIKVRILFCFQSRLCYNANIFNIIFTLFTCVPLSTVISLNCLHLIAAPSTVE